jgi:hypothetical protein
MAGTENVCACREHLVNLAGGFIVWQFAGDILTGSGERCRSMVYHPRETTWLTMKKKPAHHADSACGSRKTSAVS